MSEAPSHAPSVGEPLDRIDGRLKVTGGAKYAVEFPLANMTHAVLITSAIANGRVKQIDSAAAEKAAGVLTVITPKNAPRLTGSAPTMRVPTLLQDDVVHYNGQPIGVIVADTLEHAMGALDLIRVQYTEERPVLDMDSAPKNPPDSVHPLGGERSTRRGDVEHGLAEAAVRVDHTYTTPLENHNPMELQNTIAAWEGDQVTLYDSTQGIFSVRDTVAKAFGLKPDDVRLISYFTGGGFGSKGGAWSHQILAAMAARTVKRPVKLALTRRQMFGPVGGRPITVQRISLGATRDGALTAIRHGSTSSTSTIEDWIEHRPGAGSARG